jgi:membrane peptidoglycan carboxypeptidase
MNMTKKVLQFLAIRLIHEEWEFLRPILVLEYRKYIHSKESFPPVTVQRLLISGEDHRFFSHPGFDLIAICRAIYRRLILGKIEGASTIEQQIVRVLTGKYERTIKRKLREILLAVLLTRVVPKSDLPSLYLRIGYYGWRMNNYRQACARLGLNATAMSLREAAGLIARLKYPEPCTVSVKREAQITRRAVYLMNLYALHISTSVYRDLSWKVAHASV